MSRPGSSSIAPVPAKAGAQWLGVLGPAAAWFASLNLAHFLVHMSCEAGSKMSLDVVSGVGFALAAAAGITGWISYRASHRDTVPLSLERTRLLGMVSGMSGGLFSLLILTQWLAILMISPCRGTPADPEAPTALRGGPPTDRVAIGTSPYRNWEPGRWTSERIVVVLPTSASQWRPVAPAPTL